MVSHPWVFVLVAILIIALLAVFPRGKANGPERRKSEVGSL